MRTFKIIGLVGFALLCISSLLVIKSAMAIEKAKYTVLKKKMVLKSGSMIPRSWLKPLSRAISKKQAMRVFAASMPTSLGRTPKSSQFP
jgi:hypothetical protein